MANQPSLREHIEWAHTGHAHSTMHYAEREPQASRIYIHVLWIRAWVSHFETINVSHRPPTKIPKEPSRCPLCNMSCFGRKVNETTLHRSQWPVNSKPPVAFKNNNLTAACTSNWWSQCKPDVVYFDGDNAWHYWPIWVLSDTRKAHHILRVLSKHGDVLLLQAPVSS